MIRKIIERILEFPSAYSALGRIVTLFDPDTVSDALTGVLKAPVSTALEVGCGPKRSKISQQAEEVVCIDINSRYLVTIRESGAFVVQSSATQLPFPGRTFDSCFCSALLHHLSDDDLSSTVQEMLRVLRVNGQIIIFEYVLPNRFVDAPLAWITCKLDRGRFVRKREHLLRLLVAHCNIDLQNQFTYSWLRLRGVALRCSAK